MRNSIQDYVKLINSRLSWLDILSLLITVLFLLGLTVFLYEKKKQTNIPVLYLTSTSTTEAVLGAEADSRPFASINGKTYTFSWCNGSSVISPKNKIYFNDESAAQNSGRALSKLCQK